jgi:hypothetical protein
MELESVLIQNQSHYVVVLRERIFGDDANGNLMMAVINH